MQDGCGISSVCIDRVFSTRNNKHNQIYPRGDLSETCSVTVRGSPLVVTVPEYELPIVKVIVIGAACGSCAHAAEVPGRREDGMSTNRTRVSVI